MAKLETETIFKIVLGGLSALPAPVLFPIFRERPLEIDDSFAYLRIGLALVSFMIYMIGKYTVGFLRMAKLPRLFHMILAVAVVGFVLVIGVFASFCGKWWAEYLPHGAIGLYAAWRMRV
ncbi:MAG: hypothetical protein ABIM74_04785 [candidate division WOR-3 bacterium]